MTARRAPSMTLRPSVRRWVSVALVGLVVSSGAAAAIPAAPEVTAAASATSSGTIDIDWTPVDGAVGYLVVPQRMTTTGGWTAVEGRTRRITAPRTVVFSGLVDGTTYRGCVAAVLPDGFSTGVSEPAVPYGLPGVPVITETERSGSEVSVTWTPPASNGRPLTGYSVDVVPATVDPIVVGGNQTTVTIEGLDEATEYTVTVRATNLRGQGEPGESEPTPGTPEADPASTGLPGVPEVLRVSAAAGPCAGAVSGPTAPDPGATDGEAARSGAVAEAVPGSDAASSDEGEGPGPEPTVPQRSSPSEEAVESPEEVDGRDMTDAPTSDQIPSDDVTGAPVLPRADEAVAAPPSSGTDRSAPRASAWFWWALAAIVLMIGGAAALSAVRARG